MVKTDIFQGERNKDVFGKSTVGLPALHVPEQIPHHLCVSYLLKQSNGNKKITKKETFLSISQFSFMENHCAFATKLLLLFPRFLFDLIFSKAQGVIV